MQEHFGGMLYDDEQGRVFTARLYPSIISSNRSNVLFADMFSPAVCRDVVSNASDAVKNQQRWRTSESSNKPDGKVGSNLILVTVIWFW